MITVPPIYHQHLSPYTYIDLFAGIGGFHLAMSSFGAECVFVSEWDKHAASVYTKNFGCDVNGDITQIDASNIPHHDILCAGFPCQAFSISGKQLGFQDTRGTLFFDVARIAAYHTPKVLLLENVANFARHDNGRTLTTIISVLTDLNYRVFHKVLDASSFGIPQHRARIYILAFHDSLQVSSFNFPNGVGFFRPMSEILEPLVDDYCSLPDKYPPIFNKNVNLDYPLFDDPLSKPYRVGIVNKGGQGERIYHPSGQAITLSAYGGGVGAKTGLYLIDGKVRKLSPRECARLMGFPDTFEIHDSRQQAYKQFGNSVVIDVLQHLLLSIIKQGIL